MTIDIKKVSKIFGRLYTLEIPPFTEMKFSMTAWDDGSDTLTVMPSTPGEFLPLEWDRQFVRDNFDFCKMQLFQNLGMLRTAESAVDRENLTRLLRTAAERRTQDD